MKDSPDVEETCIWLQQDENNYNSRVYETGKFIDHQAAKRRNLQGVLCNMGRVAVHPIPG